MTTIKPRLTVAIALFVLLGIAAAQAWRGRQIAGIAYGPGKAVVGRNRLVSYASDKSKMCDKTADEGFSHIEGYKDHNLHLLASSGQNG